MNGIRKEILELITANEKIQSLLAKGLELSMDESEIIRMCAKELIAGVDGAGEFSTHRGGIDTSPPLE